MNQKFTLTAVYYLVFILLGLTLAAEGPTLLKLAEHTSSEIDEISLIFFFGALGYLAGSYTSGILYDRIPGHQLISAMLVLLGIFIIFVPLATSLAVLIGIVLVLGFAKGALDVGGNTLLLWLHNEKVGPFMNGLHAFFGLGAALAPVIVARVLDATGDIHWVFWIFSIASFPIALLVWRFPSPQPRAVPAEHKETGIPVVPIAIMVACFILYVGAEVSYGNWIYAYAVKLGLYTEITANSLNSAFWGFFTLGRLLAIWISTRLRPLTILYLDFAGCILSMGLIALFRDSATFLWFGSILLGISFASIFPTFITLSEERMHVTGTITGWFLVGGSLGGMIVPVLIGQTFDRFGPTSMIMIVFATILLNLIALFLFTKVSVKAQVTGDKIPLEI
jgi:MFS transporter, FHS family, Na+ dependent glucose transporter 1